MRIRKREAAVVEPKIRFLGVGWKQVEVQEQEDREPKNDDDAVGDVAAVCSSSDNNSSRGAMQQSFPADQGRREHELPGWPLQLQPDPDMEEKEKQGRLITTGGGAPATAVSTEERMSPASTRQLPRRRNIKDHAGRFSSSTGATAGHKFSRSIPAADTSDIVLKKKRKRKRSRHSLSQKLTSDNPAIKARDSLLSSLFHVFGATSKSGLSAREAVQSIIELGLPGLKEGGGRPSVQVANILRSSSSFLATTDKHYIFFPHSETRRERAQSQGMEPGAGTSVKEELEWQQGRRQGPNGLKPGGPMSALGIGDRKPNAAAKESPGDSKDLMESQETDPEEPAGGKEAGAVKRRRRGPLVSQKGKGRTQCKRYDGRGWQCSRLTEPGYSLCEHHQDLINKRAARLKVEFHGRDPQLLQQLATQNSKSSMMLVEADMSEEEDDKPNRSLDPTLLNRDCSIDHVPVHRRKMVKLLSLKAIK